MALMSLSEVVHSLGNELPLYTIHLYTLQLYTRYVRQGKKGE